MEVRILDDYQMKARRLRAQYVGRLLFAAVVAIDLAVRRIAHRIAVRPGRHVCAGRCGVGAESGR
jgi:hypothetical protein